ncbi:MAG: heptaprenyl diphosphate synthase component 1 [Alicyclobacillaceae bacterium]|nr:heptaprenyl diphosphate synthase component 1 [Alicyclobacillaceae bacterium]
MAIAEADEVLYEEVDKRVQRYMYHPFLQASQVRQSVSRFHFQVGHAILRSARVAETELRAVLEAVLLLHQGLSIHDDVDGQSELKRQLHVLAGDYDSSWYYWVLARLGNHRLLSSLCEAVVRINEAKMMLVQPGGLSAERYMELEETVQGALLYALASEYLQRPDDYMPQIRSLVQAYVVNEAMHSRRTPRPLTFRQAYGWLTDAVERVLHLPAGAILEPISTFVIDYMMVIKKTLESQTLVEGNR